MPNDQMECDAEATSSLKANQLLLHVRGMVCGMCVQGITKLLSALDGVKEVKIELEAGTVLVSAQRGTSLKDEALREAIKKAGYELHEICRPASTEQKGGQDG